MSTLFIHALWRTGSTYFWSKYRAQPNCLAYFEPFHEALLDARETVLSDQFQETRQLLRHPDMKSHYFSEYPFLPEGGVAHFSKDFSYDRYVLDEEESAPGIAAYLDHLVKHARAQGRSAVFQCNRTALRTAWLRRHAAGKHIYIVRDPIDQFASYLDLNGNPYFLAGTMLVAGKGGRHPLLRPLAEAIDLPRIDCPSVAEEMDAYYRWALQAPLIDTLTAHFYLWLVSFLYNLKHADLVIDMNLISDSPGSRAAVEGRLAGLGFPVSLRDCLLPRSAERMHTDLLPSSWRDALNDQDNWIGPRHFAAVQARVLQLALAHLRPALGLPADDFEERTAHVSGHLRLLALPFAS